MKKAFLIVILAIIIALSSGCQDDPNTVQITATTLPVYEFSQRLCLGTNITVVKLINEEVSCLHDYTLQVSQMRELEASELVIVSGAGLEDFMTDALNTATETIDASSGIELHCDKDESHNHEHHHDQDPHIWLSPANAKIMAQNIYNGLVQKFPQHTETFHSNLNALIHDLDTLSAYAERNLSQLSCRKLVTFHDGFSYFAKALNLTILHALEEESGSEASAAELIEIIGIITSNNVPAIFTETNGSNSAAKIISAETGAKIYTLNMAMSGESYFDAMYHNIDTIKEALG